MTQSTTVTYTYPTGLLAMEHAKINIKTTGNTKFSSNAYNIYVKGDDAYMKIPHFHVGAIQEGWEARFTLDGKWHSNVNGEPPHISTVRMIWQFGLKVYSLK